MGWLPDHSLKKHILAPLWLSLSERMRWKIVYWLNKSRRQCWADLVSDALASREDDACDVYMPSLLGERAPRCATTCDWMGHTGEHACSCYCGKFQFTATEGYTDRKRATS